MSDWIKFRKKLLRDGRVLALSRSCHASRVTVIGALVTLWCIGDEYAEEDGELRGYSVHDLNSEIGIDGFCEKMPDDWLEVTETGKVILPNYLEHNGVTARKRDLATRRQASRRERDTNTPTMSRNERDKSVTREEERREEERREEEKKKKKSARDTKQKFQPPTIEEVQEFCQSENLKMDPSKFVNHFTANGWKVSGRSPMKDWRAAARNWALREKEFSPKKQPSETIGMTPEEQEADIRRCREELRRLEEAE